MNLVHTDTSEEIKTMSHLELAEFTGSRPDSVKRTIERLSEQGIVAFTPMVETFKDAAGRNQSRTSFNVNKRDSYIIVAQIDAKFTADLVDRWQALESGASMGLGSTPKNYICGDSSLITEYGSLAVAGLPVFDKKNKVYRLASDFVLKEFTVSKSGSTYMKLPFWIMDMAKSGYRRVIFVTNANNPNLHQTKRAITDMIDFAGDNMRICLMTDKSASVSVPPSPRALLRSK